MPKRAAREALKRKRHKMPEGRPGAEKQTPAHRDGASQQKFLSAGVGNEAGSWRKLCTVGFL